MIQRRRRLLALLAAPPVLLSFLVAGGHATAGDTKPGAAAAVPTAADQQKLRVETALAKLSARAAGKSALGTYFDPATSQYVVAVPKSGLGSTLRAADVAVPGVAVRVEKRNVTRAAIDQVGARIQQRAWHPSAKQFSYGFYVEPQRGTTVLQTNAPAAVVAPLLGQFPGAIAYQPGLSGRTVDRYDDSPAFWGAASINSGGATCTAGFTVQNSAGTRFMVTAAHCFGLGATVNTRGGTFNPFGTVVSRGPFPTWDLELIGNRSYGGRVYRANDLASGATVLSGGDPAIGFTGYCFNGQTTGGESCGHTVTSLSASFCDASGCTPGLIAFSGGASVPRPGDSGAPFYLPGASGVWVRGVIIAVSGATGYAERYNTVAAHFGVTASTS